MFFKIFHPGVIRQRINPPPNLQATSQPEKTFENALGHHSDNQEWNIGNRPQDAFSY